MPGSLLSPLQILTNLISALCETGTNVILVSPMRKWRHREVKLLAQGHTASKRQSLESQLLTGSQQKISSRGSGSQNVFQAWLKMLLWQLALPHLKSR